MQKQATPPTRKKRVSGTRTTKRAVLRTKPRVSKRRAAPSRPRTLSYFLRTLRAHLPDLTARYHIKSLGVFGSYVRKDATSKSDLDVLIDFEEGARISLFGFLGIQNELSDLVGVKVDLAEKKMLRSPIKEHILSEVVIV